MALLSLSHVSMHHGGPLLLDDVSIDVERGRKIGVIGPNGAGKTTILRMLVGEVAPVAGRVHQGKGVRVAYQAQELVCRPGATVLEELRRGFSEEIDRGERLRELEERMAGDLDERDHRQVLLEYERLQREHDATGGYDVERRIETVLSSLGLPEEAWDQPIERFSGGERNVVGLARVLLSRPDVMLLDEPSNHLDLEGVEWFADFVRQSRASVVMVSHNRHLLDATVQEIWEVRRTRVKAWTGNYTAYRKQHKDALALQARQYKTQQREIERLSFQARRLKDMANAYDDAAQAKKAKAMERRIERMDKVERPDDRAKRLGARLGGGGRHGRLALDVRNFTFRFGDRVLFEDAELHVEFGERVCLVGPNGSGKSTLLREVLENGGWEHETLRVGKSVRVGEYRQLHEDALDLQQSLVDWTATDCDVGTGAAADLLHRFGFHRDDLPRAIDTLSGGEKSRLQLARLTHRRVNFLILDEPTNHLDIEACEQLEETLQGFDGTLLVVSHDRYFLDRLVSRVVEVEDKKLVSHQCSFREWWEAKKEAREQRRKSALELRSRKDAAAPDAGSARERREEQKRVQRERRQMATRLRRVETAIERLEARKNELSAAVETAYAEADGHERGAELSAELVEVDRELRSLYDEWSGLADQA